MVQGLDFIDWSGSRLQGGSGVLWRVVLSVEAGVGGWLGQASDAGGLDFRELRRRLFLS